MDYRQLYRASFNERTNLLEKELESAWGKRDIPRYLRLCEELGIEPQLDPELENLDYNSPEILPNKQNSRRIVNGEEKIKKYFEFYQEACRLNQNVKDATPERILLEKYFHKFGSSGTQPVTRMDDYGVKSLFRGIVRSTGERLKKVGLI